MVPTDALDSDARGVDSVDRDSPATCSSADEACPPNSFPPAATTFAPTPDVEDEDDVEIVPPERLRREGTVDAAAAAAIVVAAVVGPGDRSKRWKRTVAF